MRTPYIGITGICNDEDIQTLRMAETVLAGGSHILMAGILVSHKTLTGLPTTNRRYPLIDEAVRLAKKLARFAWPVAHYNTSGCQDPLSKQLETLAHKLDEIEGIQLNVVRPDPAEVAKFRETHPDVEIILQVNRHSPADYGVQAILDYVRLYEGSVDYALLDLSGGEGRPLDAEWALEIYSKWPFIRSHSGEPVGLGVAGGLGPNCKDLIEPFYSRLKTLSLDAEGGLRVPVADPIPDARYQDRLDRDKALGYVSTLATFMGAL